MKSHIENNSDIISLIIEDSKIFDRNDSKAKIMNNIIFRNQIESLKLLIKESYKLNNEIHEKEEKDGSILVCSFKAPCNHKLHALRIENNQYSTVVSLNDLEIKLVNTGYSNKFVNSDKDEVLSNNTTYICPECEKEFCGKDID